MNKLFLTLILFLPLLTFNSCSEDESLPNDDNLSLQKVSQEDSKLVIENSEVIQVGNIEELKGFNIQNDYSLSSILDRNQSILFVPVKKKKINIFDNTQFETTESDDAGDGWPKIKIKITIRIARVRPNNSGICNGNCMCGVGFRCIDIDFILEKNEDRTVKDLSRDRLQEAYVVFNEVTNNLEFHFINDIDWDYLENN